MGYGSGGTLLRFLTLQVHLPVNVHSCIRALYVDFVAVNGGAPTSLHDIRSMYHATPEVTIHVLWGGLQCPAQVWPRTLSWSEANAQHHPVQRGCDTSSHAEFVYTQRERGAADALQVIFHFFFNSPHLVCPSGGREQLTQQPCYMSHTQYDHV